MTAMAVIAATKSVGLPFLSAFKLKDQSTSSYICYLSLPLMPVQCTVRCAVRVWCMGMVNVSKTHSPRIAPRFWQ